MSDRHDLLKNTVFRVLSHGQKLDDTLKEVNSLKTVNGYADGFFASATEFTILPVLLVDAHRSRSSVGGHGAAACAQKLISIATQESESKESLTEIQKHDADIVIQTVEQLIVKGHFDLTQFQDILFKNLTLPLEIFILLHQHGIIRLDAYISRFQKDSYINTLKAKFTALCREEKSARCLAVVLSELIFLAFSDQSKDSQVKMTATSLLDLVFADVLNHVLDEQTTHCSTSAAFSQLSCDLDLLKMAATHILSMMISYRPTMKVSQAVRLQDKWAFGKISPHLVELLKQLLLVFQPAEVLSILGHVLEQQEVNWQLLLSLVSVLTVCMPESSSPLLEFSDGLLREGLEECEMEPTIAGLLLVRQACFQGPHVFLSYADWFQRTFSDGSRSLASARKSFTFFIKFLSDLMPYETSHHLKAHIMRPPYVPPKCRQFLADYIMLAKTRLADLNENLEVSGNDGHPGEAEKTDADVASAVSLFETTGKVPTSVMEASIFKKPYYIGQFLPVLLKPRPLPDYPDSKMRLISALKKSDKIPPSLYSTYVKACKREAQQLLDGVFLDSDTDDMELSPLDQLGTSLEHLATVVMATCSHSTSPQKYTETECISHVCEKIETVLSVSPTDISGDTRVRIDMEHLNIHDNFLQVIDVLLNKMASIHKTVFTSPDPYLAWLPRLLQALLRYSSLRGPLCMRILDLCFNRIDELASHHIETLAAILVELHLLCCQLGDVQLHDNNAESVVTSFTECVLDRIPTDSADKMKNTLRLCTMYLCHVFSCHDDKVEKAVPMSLVTKFAFLAPRLHPAVRDQVDAHTPCDLLMDRSGDIVSTIWRSDIFQRLSKTYPLPVYEWVCFELIINAENDVFSSFGDRQTYYDWVVYNYFLPQIQQLEEPGCDCQQLASILFKTVIERTVRPNYQSQKCGKCNRTSSRSTESMNCHNIINLVQQLTMLFSVLENDNTETLPWLLHNLDEMLQAKQDNTGLVNQFLRFGRGLSSHLLFADVPFNLTSSHLPHLEKTVSFINTNIVLCISEGVCLPVHFTSYLVHGLCSAVNRKLVSKALDVVCEGCPALLPALLMHHHTLLPYILQVQTDTSSKYSRVLISYRSKIYSKETDAWSTACMMFAYILYSQQSEVSSIMSYLNTQQVSKQVVKLFVDMCKLQYTHRLTTCEHTEEIKKLSQSLVSMVTSPQGSIVMEHLLSPVVDPKVEQCCRSGLLNMVDYGILTFLSTHSGEINLADHLNSSGLTRVLEMFVSVNQKYDTDSSNTSNTSKMVDIAELSSLVRFLQTLVSTVSFSVMQQVDKNLILNCGPGVADAILRKI